MRFLIVNKGKDPLPPEKGVGMLDALEAWGKRYSAAGKLEQTWGFAGIRGGAGILDVDSLEELDEIVSANPLVPFSETEIYPLLDMHEVIAHGKHAMESMMAGAHR